MHELEEQAIREENKSCHNFLSTCQAILLHAPQPLKENLWTSYHIFVRAITFITSICFIHQDTPGRGTAICNHFSQARTQVVPMARRWHPLPDPWGSMSMDETSSKVSQEGSSSPKRRETPNWFASLKPSCAEAFSSDSNPMKETRLCYFATHPCDWIHDNTNDLSDIFRKLAEGAGLLGESIHKIQLSWDGPEELKHANYALQSCPKG